MFEYPDAKRVKRSEIFNQDSDGDIALLSDDEVGRNSNTQIPDYGFQYEFVALSRGHIADGEDSSILNGITNSGERIEAENGQHGSLSEGSRSNDESRDPLTRAENPPTGAKSSREDQKSGVDQLLRNDDDDGFEFRLFSSRQPLQAPELSKDDEVNLSTAIGSIDGALKDVPPVQTRPSDVNKIRLRSPTPPSSVPLSQAKILRSRPAEYYFTAALPSSTISELQSQYFQTALSGAEILEKAASTPWPGAKLSWRVIHIPTSTTVMSNSNTANEHRSKKQSVQDQRSGRTRPSKKRRILMRKRLAARNQSLIQAQQKEELDKDKRTKRNREKKVKKKEREKRMKLETVTSTAGDSIGIQSADRASSDRSPIGV